MSQINSNTKDFQVVFLLSCFVRHPVALAEIRHGTIKSKLLNYIVVFLIRCFS